MCTDYTEFYKKIGHRFKNVSLLKLALTHCSANGRSNNERLEFLGDSILNFIIGVALYDFLPEAQEGELSRIRALLVKRETLATVSTYLNMSAYLRLGAGERKTGGFRRESILANAVEALIGALYLDAGFSVCQSCIREWYTPWFVADSVITAKKDPKTVLQEFLQARKMPLPEYQILSVTGEAHAQNFEVACQIQMLHQPAVGIGNSRKKAEQHAAQLVLQELGHVTVTT